MHQALPLASRSPLRCWKMRKITLLRHHLSYIHLSAPSTSPPLFTFFRKAGMHMSFRCLSLIRSRRPCDCCRRGGSPCFIITFHTLASPPSSALLPSISAALLKGETCSFFSFLFLTRSAVNPPESATSQTCLQCKRFSSHKPYRPSPINRKNHE
jgi:hypothetical protein